VKPTAEIFGYLAEFNDLHLLAQACKETRAAGYRRVEAYTPFPSEEVSHAMGDKNRLAALVFCGGLTGAIFGFGLQYWVSTIAYPVNIGGRPYNSWPSFIVITFEMTVLFSALTAVIGMIALNGLPQPYHPAFNVPGFENATRNRFFLLIESSDPSFDMQATKRFMQGFKALRVEEVPH
jgi:hypothetical protein